MHGVGHRASFAHHHEVFFETDQFGQSATHHFVVIEQENSNGHANPSVMAPGSGRVPSCASLRVHAQ